VLADQFRQTKRRKTKIKNDHRFRVCGAGAGAKNPSPDLHTRITREPPRTATRLRQITSTNKTPQTIETKTRAGWRGKSRDLGVAGKDSPDLICASFCPRFQMPSPVTSTKTPKNPQYHNITSNMQQKRAFLEVRTHDLVNHATPSRTTTLINHLWLLKNVVILYYSLKSYI
jgi:hypothetical protein